MNGLKQTKYMDAMSLLGYITAALLTIMYVIFPSMWYLMVIAIVVIFVFRFIGYTMDKNEQKKKYQSTYKKKKK